MYFHKILTMDSYITYEMGFRPALSVNDIGEIMIYAVLIVGHILVN